jgi:hypothetical protein
VNRAEPVVPAAGQVAVAGGVDQGEFTHLARLWYARIGGVGLLPVLRGAQPGWDLGTDAFPFGVLLSPAPHDAGGCPASSDIGSGQHAELRGIPPFVEGPKPLPGTHVQWSG